MTYLDHHAATPLCAEASAAMRAAMQTHLGNPSSVHRAGQRAKAVVERAREAVAQAIAAHAADIVLTSGGTEACNLGVLGLLSDTLRVTDRGQPGRTVVTSHFEHPAVARAVDAAENAGYRVSRLGRELFNAPEAPVVAITADTALLAVQWVNHETGSVWPLATLVEAARKVGAFVFVDATQALGKLPVNVVDLDADAVAFAAHKIGGPAGAGALWVRRGLQLKQGVVGGGQERGRRAGTPDVIALAGFAAAASTVPARLTAQAGIAAKRDRVEAALVKLGGVVNGSEGPRVATASNASFAGHKAEGLVVAMDVEGVEVSAGAACSSGVSSASPVLRAMYPDAPWRASSALRFSLGPETTDADVDLAIAALERVFARVKA